MGGRGQQQQRHLSTLVRDAHSSLALQPGWGPASTAPQVIRMHKPVTTLKFTSYQAPSHTSSPQQLNMPMGITTLLVSPQRKRKLRRLPRRKSCDRKRPVGTHTHTHRGWFVVPSALPGASLLPCTLGDSATFWVLPRHIGVVFLLPLKPDFPCQPQELLPAGPTHSPGFQALFFFLLIFFWGGRLFYKDGDCLLYL